MVRRTLIAALLAIALQGCLVGKPKVLGPLADYPGEVSLRVPSGTLKIAGMLVPEAGALMRGASSVEVYMCAGGSSASDVARKAEGIASARGMELCAQTLRDGEKVDVYGVAARRPGILEEALVLAADSIECAVVYLRGKIDLDAYMHEGESGE